MFSNRLRAIHLGLLSSPLFPDCLRTRFRLGGRSSERCRVADLPLGNTAATGPCDAHIEPTAARIGSERAGSPRRPCPAPFALGGVHCDGVESHSDLAA